MPIVIAELARSRGQVVDPRSSACNLVYIVTGTNEDDQVRATVRETAPAQFFGLRRGRFTLEPQGGGVWYATVEYKEKYGLDYSFDTSGGTLHINQSKETVHAVKRDGFPERDILDGVLTLGSATLTSPADASFTSADLRATLTGEGIQPGTKIASVGSGTSVTMSKVALATINPALITIGAEPPPDYRGAIGVSRNGVAGTDITIPRGEFTLTRQFEFFDLSDIAVVMGLTGKTNNAPFLGFNTGELLFLGGSGAPNSEGQARVVYKFAGNANLGEFELCENLVIPGKKAWEYIWVYYGEEVENGRIISSPTAAYVERVYDEGDFSLLGIENA